MHRIRILYIHPPSALVTSVTEALSQTKDIEIVGVAPDTASGLTLIRSQTPDIILVCDGPTIVEFTAIVMREFHEAGIIIMMTGNDPQSANRVVSALAGGAYDFVAATEKSETLHSLLLSKIRCCSIKQYSNRARQSDGDKRTQIAVKIASTIASGAPGSANMQHWAKARPKFDAILIGVSTGGPEALTKLMPNFPKFFPIPIIIVLHMPKEFTGPMAAALDRKTSIRVKEAEDGEEALPGYAYLAPGGFHCMLTRGSNWKLCLHITNGPAENGCKPAVDMLFRSAKILGERVLAVVLTGMGIDGTKGAEIIKSQGAVILAQDERSSIVWGMPGSIVRSGLAQEILPLDKIAARVCELSGV